MAVVPIPSDEQVGSTLGLMPTKGWQRDDGEYFFPSMLGKALGEEWREYWGAVRDARKKDRVVIIHDGDAIDGNHHGTTQLITPRIDEQERMFAALWNEALGICKFNPKKDKQFFIRGTPTHTGPASASEERLARDFEGVVPELPGSPDNDYQDGRYTHYHFRNYIDGVLFDVMHHGPNVGTRAWTRGNGLYNQIKSVYFASLENNRPIPRVWVRAHNHRFQHQVFEGEHGKIDGFILPCWQGDTNFINRISKGEDPVKRLGGIICYANNGEFSWSKHLIEWEHYPIGEV
jgi:hypothetical protein